MTKHQVRSIVCFELVTFNILALVTLLYYTVKQQGIEREEGLKAIGIAAPVLIAFILQIIKYLRTMPRPTRQDKIPADPMYTYTYLFISTLFCIVLVVFIYGQGQGFWSIPNSNTFILVFTVLQLIFGGALGLITSDLFQIKETDPIEIITLLAKIENKYPKEQKAIQKIREMIQEQIKQKNE